MSTISTLTSLNLKLKIKASKHILAIEQLSDQGPLECDSADTPGSGDGAIKENGPCAALEKKGISHTFKN